MSTIPTPPALAQAIHGLRTEYRVTDITVSTYTLSPSKVVVMVTTDYPNLGMSYVAHTGILRYKFKSETDFTKDTVIRGLLTRIRNAMNSAYKVGAPKPKATRVDMISAIDTLNAEQNGSFSYKEGPQGEFTLRYTLPAGVPQGYLDWVVDPIREAFSNVDLDAVLNHLATLETKSDAAYHLGAEAMRSACRDIADEHREAIDEVSLSYAAPDTEYRDRPPTIEEVRALAATVECNVWNGETQWMGLQPTDQTVMVTVITIRESTYEKDVQYAKDQGVTMFRPLTIDGDLFPWPVL